MLRIHDFTTNEMYPLIVENDKKFVTHVSTGYDTLTFEISPYNDLYPKIFEEVLIDDIDNLYIVKNVDEHSDFVTIDCDLYLDDWTTVYASYRETNISLENAILSILPSGWTVDGADVYHDRHTVGGDNNTYLKANTAIQILDVIRDVWECTFVFDTMNKVLTVLNIDDYAPSGEFIAEDINLTSIGYVGSSKDFATRIYPYGKRDEEGLNPLTIASVNDGKEYLEDTTFTNRIISVGWSDERYTVPEDLKAAALLKLSELSVPKRSYTCEVRSLGENIYMYQIITLIDKRHNTRVNHRIVKWKEFEDHTLDEITLSSTGQDVESLLDKINRRQEEIAKEAETTKEDIGKISRYSLLYTIEFGEIVGTGNFYFTRKYTDRPYFMTKPYDPNIPISFLQDSEGKYIGANVGGSESQTTLFVFYCTMPTNETPEVPTS